MTAEQHEKVARAIEALIDVEGALKHVESSQTKHLEEIRGKLSTARLALVDLNAPEYN